jgi:hypothetical protein
LASEFFNTNRIYQHLPGSKHLRCDELFVSGAMGAYDAPLDGVAGGYEQILGARAVCGGFYCVVARTECFCFAALLVRLALLEDRD